MPAVSFHSDSDSAASFQVRLKYLKHDLLSKDMKEDLRVSYLQEQKKEQTKKKTTCQNDFLNWPSHAAITGSLGVFLP